MRILLLSHSFNSLTQRLFVDLIETGHDVSVEFDINDSITVEAVQLFEPDLVVAPFLKRAIPEAVWRSLPCLIVHPGPPGDRGPASLDWAIIEGRRDWGVTVLQATGEMDAGPVWAWKSFPMREATKSCLYRNEVTEAACEAVKEAVARFERGARRPPDQSAFADVEQHWRGPIRQQDRAIDWLHDGADLVLRKIASADGTPGVRDRIGNCDVFLFNARRADVDIRGAAPGEVIGRSDGAILRATRDGAVWIGHGRRALPNAIKLPAAHLLADTIAHLPVVQAPRDIWYEESEGVGYLHFPFLNGAMGVDACKRLRAAFEAASVRSARVIVLMGGPNYWSNGLDLNEIEAAASPADQSWANINAIDDLAERIVNTTDRIVIAAMCGSAGAGGVFLARCADEVWLRDGVILNPHYKDMGNLYGSELWTYLLPRHVGKERAQSISQARLPMGAKEALQFGLADRIIDVGRSEFVREAAVLARQLATSPDLSDRILRKRQQREADEAVKPLSVYRAEELQRMRRNFYGFDPSYHIARYNFVHKVAKSRTPLTIARHRGKTRRASIAPKEGLP